MKKNSGFMLFETLIVSSLVLGTLVFLYVQISTIKKTYNESFKYNTIEGLYKAKLLADYLEKTGYSDIVESMGNGYYKDITDCTLAGSLCTKIVNNSNINSVLFTSQDITQFKGELNNILLNNNLKKYIKYLKNTKKGFEYRLIIAYNNDTYASVGIGKDLTQLSSYNLINLVSNSGFESGLTSWSTSGTSNSATSTTYLKKEGNKSILFTTTSNDENKLSQTVSLKKDHKYYLSEDIYLNDDSGSISVSDNSTNYASIDFNTLRIKRWNQASSIFEIDTQGNYNLNIINSNSINSIYVDNVILIDLTDTFGAGNEPNLKWCNSNISYFDTTKTIYK